MAKRWIKIDIYAWNSGELYFFPPENPGEVEENLGFSSGNELLKIRENQREIREKSGNEPGQNFWTPLLKLINHDEHIGKV